MGRFITLGYETDENGRETRNPVRVSRDELGAGHIHIRGRTRSGKSSLSFLSIILQLMEPGEDHRGRPAFEPVVVIDLGGDQALFHALRTAAIAAGRRFRFVALSQDPEVDSEYFDPFEFFASQGPMRQATALIEALNLDPGLATDKVYFALQNVGAVVAALRAIRAEGRHPTLEELAARLDLRTHKDAQQIWMMLQMLLEYPQLSPPERTDRDRIVSFRRALEEGEVIYLFAPTMNEAMPARALAGLGMRNAIQAAIERTSSGHQPIRLWAFVDKFQEIAGRGFSATLAQCGKHDIAVLMANQTTSQLVGGGTDLASVVRDNTHMKIYFTAVGRPDMDELQNYSGDDVEVIEGGWSASNHGTSLTAHASKDFELSRDDILDASGSFGHAFFIFDDGNGYSPPRRIWMSHRIPPDIFQAIRRRPLPRRPKTNALPAPTISQPTPTAGPAPPHTDVTAPPALARLIERKRAAESFEDPSIL